MPNAIQHAETVHTQGAIIYTWTTPVPGREVDSQSVMEAFDAYYDQLTAEGRIVGHDWFLSTQGGPHHLIVRGPMDSLAAVFADSTLLDLHQKARIALAHLTSGLYATGDTVPRMADAFYETAAAL